MTTVAVGWGESTCLPSSYLAILDMTQSIRSSPLGALKDTMRYKREFMGSERWATPSHSLCPTPFLFFIVDNILSQYRRHQNNAGTLMELCGKPKSVPQTRIWFTFYICQSISVYGACTDKTTMARARGFYMRWLLWMHLQHYQM